MEYTQSSGHMYLHIRSFRTDGTSDCLQTVKVEYRESPLWWQLRGLQQTASGYGKRLATTRMVKFNGRWRRVYVCCFSNSGTAYIGKWIVGRGAEITVGDAP